LETRQFSEVEMSSRTSKIFAVFVLAGAVGAAALYPGYVKMRAFNEKIEKLTVEITEAEKENRALREQIKALREDPFYIEKQAREMGLTKEGEKVFRIKFIEGKED
jgi:cell division protein FtsB